LEIVTIQIKVAITPTSGEMFQFTFLVSEKVGHYLGKIKSGEKITKCDNKNNNIKKYNKNYKKKIMTTKYIVKYNNNKIITYKMILI
jgi:hypothetical protein